MSQNTRSKTFYFVFGNFFQGETVRIETTVDLCRLFSIVFKKLEQTYTDAVTYSKYAMRPHTFDLNKKTNNIELLSK